MSDRPKVGPADPETRRKLLREKLDEPTRAEGVAPKPEKPKKPKKKGGLGDLLDPSKERQPTHGGKTLNDVVSEAVDTAPERDE
jgi:hypothetical protein